MGGDGQGELVARCNKLSVDCQTVTLSLRAPRSRAEQSLRQVEVEIDVLQRCDVLRIMP